METKSDARSKEADTFIIESIGSQSEEIALSGLDRARDAVTRKGKDAAKNFQAWTAGIRNMVMAIRTIRTPMSGEGPSTITANFFFAPPAKAEPQEPKNVTPIQSQ